MEKTRARAPLRLGLAGGGTDLSPYCDTFGGSVLNATIDRYAFTTIIPRTDGRVVFEADDLAIREEFDTENAATRLPLHQGVYGRMIEQFAGGKIWPMTLRTTVDAPAGSGLGSSSALVVTMVDALRKVLGAPLGQYDVAHLAFEIERCDLGLPGGRQDQYAAAFGGINFIEFLGADRVIVNPLRTNEEILLELESSLLVCFSGRSRQSAEIIEQQTASMRAAEPRTLQALHQLKADAIEMKRALLLGDIEEMAKIINRSWISKMETSKAISNEFLERLFAVAFANGALAGKVSGAGGGGYLFFLAHPEDRFRVIAALNASGGQAGPVKLTTRGCETWQFL